MEKGKIAPEEQFLPLSTIFYYLMLDFYVKTGIRFSFRDKRLFEITEVEITTVDCIFASLSLRHASLTFCYFTVSLLVTVMLLYIHLHMGRIVSVVSSMHEFDMYFCFTDFIRITDFMIFLSLYIYLHIDSVFFITTIHEYIRSIFLLH